MIFEIKSIPEGLPLIKKAVLSYFCDIIDKLYRFMEAKMKKEIGNILKTLTGIVLAVSFSLSGVNAVLADETSGTSASDTTASETEGTTTTETSESTLATVDLSGKDITNIYGSQFYPFLNHKYVFEGEEVPLTTSNFYFINAFLDLCNYAYYGYYPLTGEGYYDLAAEFSGEKYKDYAEIYVKYAEKTLENTLIMDKLAAEEKISLDFKSTQRMDDAIKGIEDKAKAASKTVEEYLHIYYGPDMSYDEFKRIMEGYYLADAYAQHFCDNYQFTDEQKFAPEIRYALFMAAEEGTSDEDKKAAEKKANDIKNASDSLEKLKTLGQEAATAGTCAECNDIHVTKGQTVSAFETWALDPARKEGDIDVIYAPEYGYFVVGYLGRTEQSEDYLNDLAVEELSNLIGKDIEAGKYQFETKDTYAPAVTVAPTPTTAGTQPSSSDTAATAASSSDTSNTTNKPSSGNFWTPTNTIVVILAAVGGVALIAAIVILVVQFVRNGSSSKSKKSKKNKKPADKKPKEEKAPKAKAEKKAAKEETVEEESEDPEEE